MIIYGIMFGLLAAFSQSLSYLFARKFSSGRTSPKMRLLIASHIFMGIAGLAALPFFWPAGIEWDWSWGRPLILCAVFYLVGQGLMFVALHAAEASKVSPLLAIKVVMLAFFTWWLMGTPLDLFQWVGVVLCLGGAFILYSGGGGINRVGIIGVLGACLFYSFSDMNITILVHALESYTPSRWAAIFFGVCMTYILCGLICGPFMFVMKDSRLVDIKNAAGFGIAWLLAMVFLYATFSLVGTVFGNILQSTRGIISIMIGVLIAHMGHHHIEAHMPRKIFVRRLIAGVIMTAAIVAFSMGDIISHAS